MLKDDTNIAEWVQSKITLAEDYISTVANYMMSELDESSSARLRLANAMKRAQEQREREERAGAALLKPKPKNEEVEKIDENGLDEVASYKTLQQRYSNVEKKYGDESKKDYPSVKGRSVMKKIARTAYKQHGMFLQKNEEVMVEREDDEYHTPSKHHVQVQVSKGDGQKTYRKATVTAKEPKQAVSAAIAHYKQQGYTVHDHKYLGEETIQEGRPSQRHPLEGHEYHKKTDAELVHIAKDAHAAAEAMKSHNTTAENKYRDQANDSATVRHFRKTSGTPDWYKKKYGHMKEAFRPMDEPNYNNSIQARQKKADDANKPPFDGPYKKSTGVVTDKSGAKHGGMSIARHLAKQAAKKQAGSIKEEKQKSRKAQIIKDASKGKDKFEKDPIITDTTEKTDNLQ
jgi:hypothetical protein